MVRATTTLIAGLAGLAGMASAHPGHDVRAEAAERAAFLKRAPMHARGLSQCASKLKARGHESSNIARRQATVDALRRRKGLASRAPLLKARDLTTVLNTSHLSSLDVTENTQDYDTLFASNASCVLGPDVTQGPYYVTGELIRKDITESQKGVPLYLDIQLVDSTTCEPVPDVYIDFWHCNATGVYSGIQASGNGNSNDASNLDATFLRGIQQTDESGVVQFETIFPGHYTSRATHIHVLSHNPNTTTTTNTNNTLTGLYTTTANHVGQIFFDQDLITEVETTSPYSTNTQELTTNANDSILSEEADTIDPFAEYVLLGDSISDGVFGWISLAIDADESSSITPAAYYTADGGVENESSGGGSGSGSAPGGQSSGAPGGQGQGGHP
ncbi:intradiol ring-cleavage dioxygenase [Aspergillus homomorphus CBS 101889]|uniref:Putative extracellular dioxygenase n=1 Tax=Aspergillus homomorphus (strain CBS 101889) TaxID=1450537 RepID=A0A395I8P4_ASPHC|nr:putative extracellular dioxygenase [Aspergillus homomorphus CBS 101889]RAL16159.1 putative extracellular dioxygenase [Aspergillus homomorphus CBS 101889]